MNAHVDVESIDGDNITSGTLNIMIRSIMQDVKAVIQNYLENAIFTGRNTIE